MAAPLAVPGELLSDPEPAHRVAKFDALCANTALQHAVVLVAHVRLEGEPRERAEPLLELRGNAMTKRLALGRLEIREPHVVGVNHLVRVD